MITRTAALAALVLSLAAPARAENNDCTCVDWPAERRLSEADQVFLGRYLDRSTEGPSEVLRFDVIHSIKGAVGAAHSVRRPFELTCDRSFQKGELALVFVVKGRMPICAGNVDIDKVLPNFGAYLEGGSTVPSLDVLKLALAGRFPGQKRVWAYTPEHAGKAVQAGASKVAFIAKSADEVPVVSGTTVGGLSYVAIRRQDGIATYVLVARHKGKLGIVAALDRDLKLR